MTLKNESVAVGNDANDCPMFEGVGFSILFNPPPNLKDHLKWCVDRAEKGFKKECIVYSQSVDIIIEEPDLRLLLPVLAPELREKSELKNGRHYFSTALICIQKSLKSGKDYRDDCCDIQSDDYFMKHRNLYKEEETKKNGDP